MMRTVIAVGTLLLGIGVVLAQQDLVKQRQDLMKAQGKSMYGNFNQMIRGNKAYDQATVDASITQLDDSSKKIGPLYPESTKGMKTDADYYASQKIWATKSDFDAKIVKLSQVIAEHKGKIANLDALKLAYPKINAECDSCHEVYRLKN